MKRYKVIGYNDCFADFVERKYISEGVARREAARLGRKHIRIFVLIFKDEVGSWRPLEVD